MVQTTSPKTGPAKAEAFRGDDDLTGLSAPKFKTTNPTSDLHSVDLSELNNSEFEDLRQQVEEEDHARSPEGMGETLFSRAKERADSEVSAKVRVSKDAVRLITAALTSYVDREDPRAKVKQDAAPVVNHDRERVEMTTKVRSHTFVHGKFLIWDSLVDERCGVIIRRRWRDTTQMTAGSFVELVEKLAWHFSLSER